MESPTETALAIWSAPQCPFTVEYVPRVLDDIRLAVVDAFFSLPRGGAEIGGILLGKFEKGRLQILDYQALVCEHAAGPSFVLSPQDHARLAEMLASARGKDRGTQPVGWYHSHTRSEIALSDADLEIHKRYFPEPWQVALVIKPHTFQPTRAGFFFREPAGTVQGSESYREFTLEPLAVKRLPGAPPTRDSAFAAAGVTLDVQPIEAPPQPDPAPAPSAPAPSIVEPEGRTPVTLHMQRRKLRLWAALSAATLVAAIGAWGYHTRDLWLPGAASGASPADYIGLNTIDLDGQLQIRWDRNSQAVRHARDGIVVIEDGPSPEAVELDAAHLQAGLFTYTRKGTHVDVAMTLNRADGRKVKESTSYLGALPERKAAQDDTALRRERDKLAADLQKEIAHNRKLEKSLAEVRGELKKMQQRKRMSNQAR